MCGTFKYSPLLFPPAHTLSCSFCSSVGGWVQAYVPDGLSLVIWETEIQGLSTLSKTGALRALYRESGVPLQLPDWNLRYIIGSLGCRVPLQFLNEVCGIIVGSPGCGVKFPNWSLWYGGNAGVCGPRTLPGLELCVIRGYGGGGGQVGGGVKWAHTILDESVAW